MESTQGRLTSFGASVESITKSVEDKHIDVETIKQKAAGVTKVLTSQWIANFGTVSRKQPEENFRLRIFSKQFEEVCIGLWNATVARRASKHLDDATGMLLCQLVYDLITCPLCAPCDETEEQRSKAHMHRCIMIGLKTGKNWLDLCEFDKAALVLKKAKQSIDKLQTLLQKETFKPDVDSDVQFTVKADVIEIAKVNKYHLKMLTYLSQVMFGQKIFDESADIVKEAASCGFIFEAEYSLQLQQLISVTYNFGVKCFEAKSHSAAIKWLEISVDLERKSLSPNDEHLSQSLRLMAHACYESGDVDNMTKAMTSLDEADQHRSHPSASYLRSPDPRRKRIQSATTASSSGNRNRSYSWNHRHKMAAERRKALQKLPVPTGHSSGPSSTHSSPLNMRLKILTQDRSTSDDDIKPVIGELLRHTELEIDLGLNACAFLNTHGRFEACESGLDQLLSRFSGSRHVGRVHAQRLQAAIERLPPDDSLDCVERFLEGQVDCEMDDLSHQLIQLLLWEQASKCEQAGSLERCLSWYDLSLRLFQAGPPSQERKENMSKLFRNKSSCLLRLNKLDEACDAADSALQLLPSNVFSQFAAFKVRLLQNDLGKATEIIQLLTSSTAPPGDTHALTCLAAQVAFEHKHRRVAMVALRHLATSGSDRVARLTALRCLIRLHLTMAEDEVSFCGDSSDQKPAEEGGGVPMSVDEGATHLDQATKHLVSALKILREIKSSGMLGNPRNDDVIALPGNERDAMGEEEFGKEVTWFMKIAWNMALQEQDRCEKMRRLYSVCSQLLSLIPEEPSVLLRHKTCLLMCAASGLHVAKNCDSSQMRSELEQVMRDLDTLERLQTSSALSDKSALLRLLYRFEALSKLTPPTQGVPPKEMTSLVGEMGGFEGADAGSFETVAALSMEAPSNHPSIYKQALKIAIDKLDRQVAAHTTDDVIERKSSLYRLLIERSLSEVGIHGNKEEVWKLFEESKLMLQGHDCKCALWFTLKAWNVGVKEYTCGNISHAERWCSLAMQLLSHLETYKEAYESHMIQVYQEIISKTDVTIEAR